MSQRPANSTRQAAAAAAANEQQRQQQMVALINEALQTHLGPIRTQLDGLATKEQVEGLATKEQFEELETKVDQHTERLAVMEGQLQALEGGHAELQEKCRTLEHFEKFRQEQKGLKLIPRPGCEVLGETEDERSTQVLLARTASARVVAGVFEGKLGVPAGMFAFSSCRRLGKFRPGEPRELGFEVLSAQQLQDLMRHMGSEEGKAKLAQHKLLLVEYLTAEEVCLKELISGSEEWQQLKAAASNGGPRPGFRRAVPYVGGQVWAPARALVRSLTSSADWVQQAVEARRARARGGAGSSGVGGVAGA